MIPHIHFSVLINPKNQLKFPLYMLLIIQKKAYTLKHYYFHRINLSIEYF